MTVKELIEELKKMPEDANVYFAGSYEVIAVLLQPEEKGGWVEIIGR